MVTEPTLKVKVVCTDVFRLGIDSRMVGAKLPARGGLRPKMAVPGCLKMADKRYLDAALFTIPFPGARPESLHFVAFLVVASSDASLRLIAFESKNKSWRVVCNLDHHHAPVLSLRYECLHFDSSRDPQRAAGSKDAALDNRPGPASPEAEGSTFSLAPGAGSQCLHLVVSGGTDGSIAVWDVTAAVDDFADRLVSQRFGRSRAPRHSADERIDAEGSKVSSRRDSEMQMRSQVDKGSPKDGSGKADEADAVVMKPVRTFTDAHQSGVNALASFTTIDGQRARMTVLSGGDDQSLFIGVLSLKLRAGNTPNTSDNVGPMNAEFCEFLKMRPGKRPADGSRCPRGLSANTISQHPSEIPSRISADAAPQVRSHSEGASTPSTGLQNSLCPASSILSVDAQYDSSILSLDAQYVFSDPLGRCSVRG